MTQQTSPALTDRLTKLAATFFGVGLMPWAPGTAGSVAGLVLAWFLGSYVWAALLVLSVIGFAICRRSTVLFSSGDPKCFVLDEVCGVMIPVLWCPKNIYIYVSSFVFFRIFDIFKPWPISLIQRSKRPSAIMWDDLLAGIVALVFSTASGILIARLFFSHGMPASA